MSKDIRNKPVAIISINGKYREGKSFLLNLLLNHLLEKANSKKLKTKAKKVSPANILQYLMHV